MTETTHEVTVLPGVPNMSGLVVDGDVVPFPDTTTDFVKILRERGIDVRFTVVREERRYVGHKAFEVWLPILEFTRDVLIALEAGLLVELIKTYIEPRGRASELTEVHEFDDDPAPEASVPAILHIEWHVAARDGSRESFIANGAVGDALDALTEFERHVRDG